jgi:2-polyprenyl-6-methoxyphenol hydroxylase-like FAD-dependent oxidoreductase
MGSDWVDLPGKSAILVEISVLTPNRTGYDFQFGARTKYLEVFYNELKSKSKILLNKNIASVEQSDNGVTVKCDDGTSYQGDILAGADGVRSKVRQELWRLASSRFPELVAHDKQGMASAYRLL